MNVTSKKKCNFLVLLIKATARTYSPFWLFWPSLEPHGRLILHLNWNQKLHQFLCWREKWLQVLKYFSHTANVFEEEENARIRICFSTHKYLRKLNPTPPTDLLQGVQDLCFHLKISWKQFSAKTSYFGVLSNISNFHTTKEISWNQCFPNAFEIFDLEYPVPHLQI